jgi:hypothetical protein
MVEPTSTTAGVGTRRDNTLSTMTLRRRRRARRLSSGSTPLPNYCTLNLAVSANASSVVMRTM